MLLAEINRRTLDTISRRYILRSSPGMLPHQIESRRTCKSELMAIQYAVPKARSRLRLRRMGGFREPGR